MRALAALAIMAACGAPKPAPSDPQPAAPHGGTVASPVLPPGPTPTVHKSRPMIEAPHAGAIQMLTATPDASAVLSVDELGGVRLWPTLDGTKEPRIVDLPAARELALGRHGSGFVAVVLDEVGGLYVAKLDEGGRTLSHTTHGIDPAFSGIVMSGRGVVAWRADHHVLVIDGDGAILDQLATEPQQRIVDLAVAGGRAVAILDRAGTRQARWLAVEPRLAWGAWLDRPADAEVGTSIALSPSHKYIAMTLQAERLQRVLLVEAAIGKQVAAREMAGPIVEVRFADDNLVAVGGSQGLQWMVASSSSPTAPAGQKTFGPARRQRELLAAGGGRAIWPSHGELMLITPSETKFLGYEALTPRLAQAGGNGQLLVHLTSQAKPASPYHLLDPQLRTVATPGLGVPAGGSVAELVWVGGDDWLVEYTRADNVLQLALVNAASDTSTLVRDRLGEAHMLAYEPSTRIATLSFGPEAEVARVELKARTLDRLVSAGKPSPYEHTTFVPVAPKLARGTQLVQVTMRDKPTIKWLPDARALDKPSATVTFEGAFAGADAAGRIYAWRNSASGKLELVVYTDGKHTATLPNTGPASVWPDPAGTRVVQIETNLVSMVQPHGSPVWSRDLAGAHDAIWLSDGALALTHASGIARLDPATGAVTAARCGWGFGLTTQPHAMASRIEPICAQLAR